MRQKISCWMHNDAGIWKRSNRVECRIMYSLRFASLAKFVRFAHSLDYYFSWTGYKSRLLIWVHIEAQIVEAAIKIISEKALIWSHKAISNSKEAIQSRCHGVFASLRSQSSFATLTHEILFFQYQLPIKQLKNNFYAELRSNDGSICTKKQLSQFNHIMNHNQQILYCGSDCRHTYAISSTRVSVISMFCV